MAEEVRRCGKGRGNARGGRSPCAGGRVGGAIPASFEKVAEAFPDRLAVKALGEQFTYAELNAAANRIAWSVLDACGEANAPLPVLLPHSRTLYAATLGVLKAGKACVPLDPSLPDSRLGFIIDHIEAPLVISDGAHAGRAADVGGRRVLTAEAHRDSVPDSNPLLPISPDALAYVLYTSGTTGEPKGVMQTHRNILHAVDLFVEEQIITPEDRVARPGTHAFIGNIRSSLGAFLSGAAYLPIDLEGVDRLAEVLARDEVTGFCSPCSAFRQVLWALRDTGPPSSLRWFSNGGEPLYRADVEQWRRIFPAGSRCIHGLASTEADAICRLTLDTHTEVRTEVVPLGYAVPGVEIRLLDEAGEPVPAGDAGQIVVRSPYLSPGYWRRPDLTDAAFRPLSGSAGRWYFTGDMGRMGPDGCLEGLGRRDTQTKIRGYRVASGEVEIALSAVKGVKEAAVVARPEASGELRLVGYVSAEPSARLTVTCLRSALAAVLPDYMVPSAFVFLDSLPLTPNGKLDRRQLPAPDRSRPRLGVAFEALRTPVEKALAELWKELLGLDKVGANDGFFDLGGNSLTAVRMAARVRERFGVELTLRTLLGAPTLAEVAQTVSLALTAEDDPSRADPPPSEGGAGE